MIMIIEKKIVIMIMKISNDEGWSQAISIRIRLDQGDNDIMTNFQTLIICKNSFTIISLSRCKVMIILTNYIETSQFVVLFAMYVGYDFINLMEYNIHCKLYNILFD